MKVAVVGLWHLGSVTAACLAGMGHDVTGLDPSPQTVAGLADGHPPLFEPGLEDLVRTGLASGRLQFTTDTASAIRSADVVWVTFDTPVDDDDRADVEQVVENIASLFPHVKDGAVLLISSQVPVGTTRRLERQCAEVTRGRNVAFAYSPENLRLGKAIAAFTRPDRIVVGVGDRGRERLGELLQAIPAPIEWMSVESAEMTKHALNSFLATSVTFINEVAALCEQVGADAAEVERGLKSEARIGPRAYLSAGAAFAGGTLARDVMFLSELGSEHGVPAHLLRAVTSSNDAHIHWPERRLAELLPNLSGSTVGVWGLTYKPGTDTLRRSSSIGLCEWLHGQGVQVRAHDPAITSLPSSLADRIVLATEPLDAVTGASALIVATPWPEYRQIPAAEVKKRMTRTLVLDAGRFLRSTLGADADVEYVSVGTAAR